MPAENKPDLSTLFTPKEIERLQEVLRIEHVHAEGQNECWLCDKPLLQVAADTIEDSKKIIAELREQIRQMTQVPTCE